MFFYHGVDTRGLASVALSDDNEINLHTDAGRQQHADIGRLLEQGKGNDDDHIPDADILQIDSEKVSLKIGAGCVTNSIKDHGQNSRRSQANRADCMMNPHYSPRGHVDVCLLSSAETVQDPAR